MWYSKQNLKVKYFNHIRGQRSNKFANIILTLLVRPLVLNQIRLQIHKQHFYGYIDAQSMPNMVKHFALLYLYKIDNHYV